MEEYLFSFYGPYSSVSKNQRRAINELIKKINEGTYKTKDLDCLCGSSDGILIADKDRCGLEVETYLCTECGLIRTTPTLDAKSLRNFYNSDYRSISSSKRRNLEKQHTQQINHGREIMKFLETNLKIPGIAIVYDIGCASGGAMIPFMERGHITKGLELNEEDCNFSKNQGLVITDDEDYFFNDSPKADIIIASHVLEHIPNPLEMLSKIRWLLNEKGVLYVELPGVLNTHNKYRHFMFSLQQAHVWTFSLSTLRNVISSVGFDFIEGDETIKSCFKKGSFKSYEKNSNYSKQIKDYLIKRYM